MKEIQKRRTYLTPRHRLNNVLLYEVEEKWKIGLEAYYFSKQQLSDGNRQILLDNRFDGRKTLGEIFIVYQL